MNLVKKVIKRLSGDVGTKNVITREEWLERSLKRISTGNRILDAGAGELQYKKFCSHLAYTSQDFGKYDGSGNAVGLQTDTWDNSKLDIISDICDIPVTGGSFDVIMCIEVFEHLPEPAKAVKEFSRILRPGGTLIITAPFCSLTHFAPYYFANGYSRYWYEKILADNGFKVEEITPNGNYFEYLAQEVRRIKSVGFNYGGSKPNFFEEIGLLLVIRLLARFSKKGDASSELLNFGYQIRAIKT